LQAITPETPVIWIWIAGANIGPHHTNPRRTSCVNCGARLEPGSGYRRKMDAGLTGSGYLCKRCVTQALWSRKEYVYSRVTGYLSPYRSWIQGFPIKTADLVAAWEQGGAQGLRVAAETGRDQARRAWLERHQIPYTPD
jgi:hypothetical protein